MKDVLAPAGEKIVEAKHFVAFTDEPLAKMRDNEPRTPCDENSHCRLTPKFPTYSTSIFVFLKHSIASCGVQTIGSFSLNDVLRITGTPVSSAKSEIN